MSVEAAAPPPSWLTGIVNKRPLDILIVLCALLEAGIRKGECSANDVPERDWSQPNVVGACFKLLPKFGFVMTNRRLKSESKKKHGRLVFVWELQQRHLADAYVTHISCGLTKRVDSLRYTEKYQPLLY